jgi:NAD(P)H-flavin reductase
VLEPDEDFSFITGQFVELSVPGAGEAPFTPSSDPNVKDELEITIMKAGKITSILHGMGPGEELGIRGPYGRGYPLDKFEGRDVLILGGGVGLAPLRSLLFALFNEIERFKSIVIRYGARTPADIVYKRLVKGWGEKEKVDFMMTVDRGEDGWQGNVGVVTTIVDGLPVALENTACIVCGPPIMMKFAVAKLLELGFRPPDIYLSMEKNMSCGLGKCGHCRLGPYYVCKDGPVFTYEQIKDLHDIWD